MGLAKSTKPTAVESDKNEDEGMKFLLSLSEESRKKVKKIAANMELNGTEEIIAKLVPEILTMWNSDDYSGMPEPSREVIILTTLLSKYKRKAKLVSVSLVLLHRDKVRGTDSPYQKAVAYVPAEKIVFSVMAKESGIKALSEMKPDMLVEVEGVSIDKAGQTLFMLKESVKVISQAEYEMTEEQATKAVPELTIPAIVELITKKGVKDMVCRTKILVERVSKMSGDGGGSYHSVTDTAALMIENFDFAQMSVFIPSDIGRYGQRSILEVFHCPFIQGKELKSNAFLVIEDKVFKPEDKVVKAPEGSEPSEPESEEDALSMYSGF